MKPDDNPIIVRRRAIRLLRRVLRALEKGTTLNRKYRGKK